MAKALLTLGILILLAPASWAQFTGFEDLVLNTAYTPGSQINSGGLTFNVVDFPSSGSDIYVRAFGDAGGSGQELSLGSSIGLDFQLSGPASGVSFLFGDYYIANTGLEINGVASTNNTGFLPLNGTMLGGVSITASGNTVLGGVQGRVLLGGPVYSLVVGGTELALDNVLVVMTVPEPAGIVLALVGLAAFRTFARCGRRVATP